MELRVHTIKPNRGATKRRKRVGRGNASGHGTYSTRGLKGQRSRSGGRGGLRLKGMKAMILSVPKKRGFTSPHEKKRVINAGDLSKGFEDGAEVTPVALRKKGLVPKGRGRIKILGDGEVTKKLMIKGCDLSSSAQEKIEKAGGSVASETPAKPESKTEGRRP